MLAFVFVPFTYVANILSANFLDMADSRTAKNFAIFSTLTTAATILAALVLGRLLPFVVRWLDPMRLHVYGA